MNLKLHNDRRALRAEPLLSHASVKEERRRTGRYIAILVGISLLFLALYQAWVRRIPLVASLIVPALIMFVYIAWVLYTASRDRRNRERDLEMQENGDASPESSELKEITEPLNNLATGDTSPQALRASPLVSPAGSVTNVSNPLAYCAATNLLSDATNPPRLTEDSVSDGRGIPDASEGLVKPIILVNDEPRAESEERENKTSSLPEADKTDGRKANKQKRFRSNAAAVFKRSYSIA